MDTHDLKRLGAENLLRNCARLGPGDKVLVVTEQGGDAHYSPSLGPFVLEAAQDLGMSAQLISIPFQEVVMEVDKGLEVAMSQADCTIFFARLGDQLRFCGLGAGRRVVVSYVLDEDMLASSFGWAHHRAFEELKAALDQTIAQASGIRITCPHGTDCSGSGHPALGQQASDVAITRFPQSVFAPVPADDYAGTIAQTEFLTGTCSRFYQPYAAKLESTLLVHFDNGRITGFDGSARDVATAKHHYDTVASRFSLDRDAVHSWHVGIHPGCGYNQPAAQNYERWCSGAFGNPRILHFHTCGAYAPGEISLNVVDPTVEIDGTKVWENGRLHPERIIGGREVLDTYPCATFAFDNPSYAIGF